MIQVFLPLIVSVLGVLSVGAHGAEALNYAGPGMWQADANQGYRYTVVPGASYSFTYEGGGFALYYAQPVTSPLACRLGPNLPPEPCYGHAYVYLDGANLHHEIFTPGLFIGQPDGLFLTVLGPAFAGKHFVQVVNVVGAPGETSTLTVHQVEVLP